MVHGKSKYMPCVSHLCRVPILWHTATCFKKIDSALLTFSASYIPFCQLIYAVRGLPYATHGKPFVMCPWHTANRWNPVVVAAVGSNSFTTIDGDLLTTTFIVLYGRLRHFFLTKRTQLL
jgi:hypothetical protein